MQLDNNSSTFQLNLPCSNDSTNTETLNIESPLIIVGANGSGKTRLGVWIEDNNDVEKTYRISAQKMLVIPDRITTSSLEDSQIQLWYGVLYANPNEQLEQIKNQNKLNQIKTSGRWQNKPFNSTLNDYQKLLQYLFTEDYRIRREYTEQSKQSQPRIEPPSSKLDKVKEIWEKVLPHRQLIIRENKIEAKVKREDNSSYQASEMSDGERVIFYLIGQSLSAPENNGIIIIDEPEIHIHKSIFKKLWLEIEAERQDCLFVYLTHDLDFASSYKNSTKIWLQEYNNDNWIWAKIEPIEHLPEELYLEIKGSREPIIFVEGDNNSLDIELYKIYYSNYHIIPLGGCCQVIDATKQFKNNQHLHQHNVYGIIDRDRRNDNEIQNLREDNVYCLDIAEIENIFLVPEIIKIVAEHLGFNYQEKQQKINNWIIQELNRELFNQIKEHLVSEIKYKLDICPINKKEENISNFLKSYVDNLDINQIENEIKNKFNNAIESKNYLEIIKLYNRKSICKRIGFIFDLGEKDDEYSKLVLRLAKGTKSEEIKQALTQYLPHEISLN